MLIANSALRANRDTSLLGYFTFSTQIKACKQNLVWISADSVVSIDMALTITDIYVILMNYFGASSQ